MTVENAQHISELVETNPPGSDPVLEGDDHFRMVKNVLKTQFPNIKATGILNATDSEALPNAIERLWSPDAVLAFLIANWDAYSQTPVVNNLTFRAENDGATGAQLRIDVGANRIPFNVAAIDAGGLYDEGQARWVPGELGDYWIWCQTSFDPNFSGQRNSFLQIRVNGAVVSSDFISQSGNPPFAMNCGALIQITDAADFIEAWIDTDLLIDGMWTDGARSFMTGFKINAAQPSS